MSNEITVGSDEYRQALARANALERLCDQRQLTVQEQSEFRRLRATLETAELRHAQAQAGSVT